MPPRQGIRWKCLPYITFGESSNEKHGSLRLLVICRLNACKAASPAGPAVDGSVSTALPVTKKD
jgi:hypothetical protein